VRLEGSLDAFSLPDIFSLLSMTKKTGGLHLRRADAHGVVWLNDGLVTGGVSDLRAQALARRLVCSTQVNDELLIAAVAQVSADPSVGLARALRDSRAIDEGDLQSLVAEHVVDTVFDLMRWPDGEFAFVVDEVNADDVGVTRDVDEVVTEARSRLEIWSGIDGDLATPTAVISLALTPEGDLHLAHEEWALLALIDGRRTVGDLVAMSGRGEYSVVVALAELLGRGLVHIGDNAPVSALLSRMDLVASLEPSEPVPAQIAAVLTEPASAGLPEPTPSGDGGQPDQEHAGAQVADLATLPRSSTLSEEIASVTPQRPEPFLPQREVDHPEPLAAAAVGGGVLTAPAPAGAIERDPSVNKSLLLRLIAGVRGL